MPSNHRLFLQTRIRRFVESTDEFLSRLSNDLPQLLAAHVGGRLQEVLPLPGDPHRGGRTGLYLSFDEGTLFYKPRCLDLECRMLGSTAPGEPLSLAEQFNIWLEPAVGGGRLPTYPVFRKTTTHGYVGKISPRVCRIPPGEIQTKPDGTGELPPVHCTQLEEGEEPRFWYSAGLLAGFCVLLGLTDQHAENIVCGTTQNNPLLALYPIDLETALIPVRDLEETGLVDLFDVLHPGLAAEGHHRHPGLEKTPRYCCGETAEEWVFEELENGIQLTSGLGALQTKTVSNLVRNSGGDYGYGCHLPLFLKGIIDIWGLARIHSAEIETFLRENLSGLPIRNIIRPTWAYGLEHRKWSGLPYPLPGASWKIVAPEPAKLHAEETQQLEQGDIPYFSSYLGDSERLTYWFDPESGRQHSVASPDPSRLPYPSFGAMVREQTRPQILARSLADAALFVAPAGRFDWREEQLGVRVFRPDEKSDFWLVARIQAERLTCRVSRDGKVRMWWVK